MSTARQPDQPDFDERDANRARRLGAWLESEEHAIQEDDGFFTSLFSYREKRAEEFQNEPSSEQSARMWMRIADAVAASSAPRRARIYTLRPWQMAVAVAASVLLGIALVLLMSRSPEALILAEAGTSVTTFTAEDGSTVTLRPHSTLYTVAVEAEATVRYRIEGEALFETTAREGHTVEVEASEGLVTVLGTRFTVSTWSERVEVFLLEGSVRFEHPPSERSLVLVPGFRAALDPDGEMEEAEFDAPDLALGWLENEMVFEERPVRRVVSEVEHHHRIRIEIPDEMKEQTLTGRILLEDPQQSLDDLGVVMGGSFEQVDNRTYRFQPD